MILQDFPDNKLFRFVKGNTSRNNQTTYVKTGTTFYPVKYPNEAWLVFKVDKYFDWKVRTVSK